MAMKHALRASCRVVASVLTFLTRMPVTPVLSPSTSSSTWSHWIVALPSRRPSPELVRRIFSARNLSRRWITVTWLRDVGEVERFLDRGVAAADDRHVLALVEEAVAGGAAGHALAHERLLGRQAEVHRRGAGGDDQRVAGVGARIADQRDRASRRASRCGCGRRSISVSKRSACFWKRSISSGPWTPIGVGRPVVDVGGGHELAALGEAGDEHGFQVGAGGVDGGGVAGGAGAEDEEAAVFGGLGHVALAGCEGVAGTGHRILPAASVVSHVFETRKSCEFRATA